MTPEQIEQLRRKLLADYPGAHVKVAPDDGEMVAEIDARRAVAVIERSQPHFHSRMTEVYRVLQGVLYVSCGGRGYVLGPGQELTIEPGNVHFARGAGGPAWLEVLSDPPWTPEDHHIL